MQLSITKPLNELQDDAYNKIRLDLQDFIFETSDFPVWKQANYSDIGSELGLKELAASIIPSEQSTLDNVRLVRAWKNVLLAERDRVKALIYSSTNASEIKISFESMVYTPPPFNL